MSDRILPPHPDLHHLRRQAKALKRSAQGGDTDSPARVAAVSDDVSLSAAQLAIAREYGAPSWRRLQTEARRLRAIAEGDADALSTLVKADPSLATAPIRTEFASEPLAPIEYVGVGRLHGAWSHRRAAELTRILIAAAAYSGARQSDALITAVSHGETAMARALIDSGAAVEAVGPAAPGSGTALAHAVHYGMVESVDLLISAGAVVHDVVEAAGTGDVAGFLPAALEQRVLALRAASVCERRETIDALLRTGVDVNTEFTTITERNGGTAIHCAAREGKAASVAHLLACGADPDRLVNNMTALQWCRRRHSEVGPGWGHADVEKILAGG